MSEQTARLIVLKGSPGSGKTTLVKKVCDGLRAKNVTLNGFFTEEIRVGRERVGFDVVLLNGTRAPLARLRRLGDTLPSLFYAVLNSLKHFDRKVAEVKGVNFIFSESSKGPCVGKYVVDVESFESCVLPVLDSKGENSIMVLDEIGKMELFSEKFKDIVRKYISNKRGVVLATIPNETSRPIPLVEMLKKHPDTCLMHVTRCDRDALVDKVTNAILSMKGKVSTAQD